ncbi:protease m14 carboxypeptidase [Holotrichia oblita]|uniref:Protease m14 carboxypeptidase n=1 Tax=Holotrichia oblita TaxID=644536 RepID=A0ACB9TTF9_HOLOL|nr:protease m14 carboxypeptidase [Holotrichia oblita]
MMKSTLKCFIEAGENEDAAFNIYQDRYAERQPLFRDISSRLKKNLINFGSFQKPRPTQNRDKELEEIAVLWAIENNPMYFTCQVAQTTGKELWVMKITAGDAHDTTLPNVKLIGNMHGNEVVGRELLLHFIEVGFQGTYMINLPPICSERYANDDDITWLLDNTIVHIMPSMNPDGFEAIKRNDGRACMETEGRENAEGVDLNRNFPDYYKGMRGELQPEAEAIVRWMNKTSFVLSAALHGGALVANYPFDTTKNFGKELWVMKITAGDAHDTTLPNVKLIGNMHGNDSRKRTLLHFIEHMLEWYANDDDITWLLDNTIVHIMPSMNPDGFEAIKRNDGRACMETEGRENAEGAFVKYCLQANQGVTGVIKDNYTGEPIPNATLQIVGRDMNFYSDVNGRFWRLLLSGTYSISVVADGYHKQKMAFQISPLRDLPKLHKIEINLIHSSVPLPTTTTQKSVAFAILDNGNEILDEATSVTLDEPVVEKVTSASVQWSITAYLYFIVLLILVA